MTFDQLVEKGKAGAWMTAEAAVEVQDEAKYGEASLARWAEAVGIGLAWAQKLIASFQRKNEMPRLTRLSPAVVTELASVPDEALDDLLDADPQPTVRSARAAADPYRTKKTKTRSQVENETHTLVMFKADEIVEGLQYIQSVLPDLPTTDETKRILLHRFETMSDLIETTRAAVTGFNFDNIGVGEMNV